MTVGFKQDIAQYLAQSEIETRLLVVIEYDKDNIYRFIADESLESFEICGNTYLSTQIERGSRQENADNSIDSVSLTLSNHWQEWAAILNHRQIPPPGKIVHSFFMDVQHGANLNNPGSVQVGHRLKAADPALEQQGHDEGLHSVIIVVPQSQLVEPPFLDGLI